MQSAIDHLETIISKAGDLADTKVDLWKLKAAGKISKSASSLVSIIVTVIVLGIALASLSFGAAYWIGVELGNISHGFFIVGGFYALVGLLVFSFRKNLIKTPITNLIVNKFIK